MATRSSGTRRCLPVCSCHCCSWASSSAGRGSSMTYPRVSLCQMHTSPDACLPLVPCPCHCLYRRVLPAVLCSPLPAGWLGRAHVAVLCHFTCSVPAPLPPCPALQVHAAGRTPRTHTQPPSQVQHTQTNNPVTVALSMHPWFSFPRLPTLRRCSGPVLLAAAVLSVLGGFALFAPFVYATPLTEDSIMKRHWVKSWDFLYHKTV